MSRAPAPPTQHVAVRLDPAVVVRVDALIPALSKPWRKTTRSDVLRALVLAGLEAKERGAVVTASRATKRTKPTRK